MLHYPEEDYVDDEELVSSSSPAATTIRSASALGLATQVINPTQFIFPCGNYFNNVLVAEMGWCQLSLISLPITTC
jgi:hypothetical protein